MDDLDIDNYNLDDILKLFKLEYNFTEQDLKKAQRQALKTHPDKSNLPSEYFIFFKKAYKMLSEIYYFRFRKEADKRSVRANMEMSKEQRIILDNMKNYDKRDFNKWFNKMFEDVKLLDGEKDSGYEEWFRSDTDINEKPGRIAMSQFAEEFEKKKQKCKSMAIIKETQELGGESGYSLLREKPEEYSSSIFSKLHYEDLKKAHTETVVPVTREDYLNKPKFSNVDSYRSYRDGQNVSPPSLQQSQRFLAEKQFDEGTTETQRIYKILKQDEKMQERNEHWWSSLKHLTNR